MKKVVIHVTSEEQKGLYLMCMNKECTILGKGSLHHKVI